ncbi:efflux transporter periplasmic adaptor subunit [Denitratisoma sp. DHT3]|uniref:efflux RND transporter periplasmic adaptor subunit n=1 Tax=Denitratisoma sp. DHT3 TaxID=1981880 RepID=UPI0011985CE1|nr:efflux RND transporter periplasmic adaptor subunit [Denitratisoma sp. DHT3]QDX82178.1 efflux transporter periplasmic adaptor subunit [Denitratisoma sp. DHT3]
MSIPTRRSGAMPGLFLPALLLGAALLGTACSRSTPPTPAAPPPLPVTVLEMHPTRAPITVEVTAQAEGSREVEVRARVGGILLRRLYQEGTPVKAGQPLFQIDRTPYEIALADAKAKAEQATREANRLKGLIEQQAVSRKEYDDAVSNQAVAQAALNQAELNLSYTTVTAPEAGVAERAVKSEGNLIAAGADGLLTVIHQANPLWVRFGLAESDLARIPGGRLDARSVSSVELVLPDGSVHPQKGRINFLAANLDTVLGTRQMRAEFANPDGALLPGQFLRVRLNTGTRDGIFLVPQAAVVQAPQGAQVMVANADNKVEPRPVQAGEWLGRDWVILGGLKAGDKVIVDNLIKLRPGAAVQPHPPQPQSAPGASPNPATPAAAQKK